MRPLRWIVDAARGVLVACAVAACALMIVDAARGRWDDAVTGDALLAVLAFVLFMMLAGDFSRSERPRRPTG